MGRIGLHSDPEDPELGSNSENLLRLSECDVLLTTSAVRPKLDVRAEESIRWTPEAEERMKRVPPLVVGIARTAILRLALEQGHSVVTSSLLDEAMERFMPKQVPMDKLAEAVAIGRADQQALSVCKGCGLTAKEPDPAVCTVCGGKTFEVLTAEMVESLVKSEGGAAEERTYDGRKLAWSADARRALRAIDKAYLRRRTKARIEKSARMRKLKTVTLEFARNLIEEETGVAFAAAPDDRAGVPEAQADSEPKLESASDGAGSGGLEDGKRLITRDDNGNPLFSAFDWTEDAIARVLRVPPGFMRNGTQGRIEELAEEQELKEIDLGLVEAGIELGLKLMAEMVAESGARADAAENASNGAPPAAARCPAVQEKVAPAQASSPSLPSSQPPPLNEVSPLGELDAMRMLLARSEDSPEE